MTGRRTGRRMGRIAALLGCVGLLFGTGVAYADDPDPTSWPSVQKPDSGNSDDPQLVEWPAPKPL